MTKRNPALVPLSRDHHDGLLLAVRLQQGTGALMRLWSHEPSWQATFIVEFYDRHLRRHFRAEDEVMFPAAEKHSPATQSLVAGLTADHREMERRVEAFRASVATATREQLAEFGRLLEEHIRKEERQLFPAFERTAGTDVLAALERQIQSYYALPT
ncbi:MAG: hemerythrin domain-containing protein [Ignavibacteriales bacterium]|nr:hemerythrin domain-containing protein [Ignavibacteriales bacterium]